MMRFCLCKAAWLVGWLAVACLVGWAACVFGLIGWLVRYSLFSVATLVHI